MEQMHQEMHQALLEQRTAASLRCGQTLSARGPVERTVATLAETIQLQCPYV
jgi:hypothetical protein